MKCPTLAHCGSSLVHMEVSSIIWLYMIKAGLMSLAFSFWPAHQRENATQMIGDSKTIHKGVQLEINKCNDPKVTTWAAKPVWNHRRTFTDIRRLVLFRQGLRRQEPIVPGHTEHRVLLRWAMDESCPHIYNISACRGKQVFVLSFSYFWQHTMVLSVMWYYPHNPSLFCS